MRSHGHHRGKRQQSPPSQVRARYGWGHMTPSRLPSATVQAGAWGSSKSATPTEQHIIRNQHQKRVAGSTTSARYRPYTLPSIMGSRVGCGGVACAVAGQHGGVGLGGWLVRQVWWKAHRLTHPQLTVQHVVQNTSHHHGNKYAGHRRRLMPPCSFVLRDSRKSSPPELLGYVEYSRHVYSDNRRGG